MKISVKGKNDILTKKHIRYTIKLFGKHLLSSKLYPNINILVQSMNLDVWGYCGIADINERKPRTFEILLNSSLSKNKQLTTLAHEMVHVKPYATLELNEQMNMWQGNYINSDVVPYMQQPWEIEAHEIGDLIYEDFINDYR